MNKTSDEFDKECGAKNDKWKGGKGVLEGRDPLTVKDRFQESESESNVIFVNPVTGKWDCCKKNETMKNGTAVMGKDEWDQFDKTKVR